MTHRLRFEVFAASCVPDGGVFRYTLSEEGKLTPTGGIRMDRPMYFVKEGERLHVLLREPQGFDGKSACVCCDAHGTEADMKPAQSTDGIVACHLSVCDGDVYAVNYLSGNIVQVGKKTVTHTSSPDCKPGRQDMPHTHCVIPSPDGAYLLCADLGLDRIVTYDRELNPVASCQAPRGCGVRHLVFSHDGKYLYCANELESTVGVYAYEAGRLTYLSTTGCQIGTEDNYAAAIRLSADGTRLYVSQRGEDVISVLEVNGKDLRHLCNLPAGGRWPRDICLTPDGRFLVTANEKSDNLAVLRLDGDRAELVDSVPLAGALCVLAEEMKEG